MLLALLTYRLWKIFVTGVVPLCEAFRFEFIALEIISKVSKPPLSYKHIILKQNVLVQTLEYL